VEPYLITQKRWQELINTPDEVGNVKIDGSTFSYYDNVQEWLITVSAGDEQERFGYAYSGIAQAQSRATEFLVRSHALKLT
jgi:hypothetical protein